MPALVHFCSVYLSVCVPVCLSIFPLFPFLSPSLCPLRSCLLFLLVFFCLPFLSLSFFLSLSIHVFSVLSSPIISFFRPEILLFPSPSVFCLPRLPSAVSYVLNSSFLPTSLHPHGFSPFFIPITFVHSSPIVSYLRVALLPFLSPFGCELSPYLVVFAYFLAFLFFSFLPFILLPSCHTSVLLFRLPRLPLRCELGLTLHRRSNISFTLTGKFNPPH